MNEFRYSRRSFIALCVSAAGGLALPGPVMALPHDSPEDSIYVSKEGKNSILCTLCPNHCHLESGEIGICRVRQNRNGRLVSLVYGKPCSIQMEPIEKQPFHHVRPGTVALTVATSGCNLHCDYCHNHELTQRGPNPQTTLSVTPRSLSRLAVEHGVEAISFNNSELIVLLEYALEVSRLAGKQGLLRVAHTNGYIERKPRQDLVKALDAVCVDLKSIDPGFYEKTTGGALKPVLESLVDFKRSGLHLEIVNLVVPGLNDQPAHFKRLAQWIKAELGPETPLHFNRFFPSHRLTDLPPTPVQTLETGHRIALESGLKFVYIGNVPGHQAESTYCPQCHKAVLVRRAYRVRQNFLDKGHCRFCGQEIPGLWRAGKGGAA